MTLPRFYHPHPLDTEQTVSLTNHAAHHAIRVLRLRQGSSITLFDGTGAEFTALITAIHPPGVTARVSQFIRTNRESPLSVLLVQAICASEKMDWIIQKVVETGVTRIQPVATTRSVINLTPERAGKRLQHWQQIVISACEQSGRNYIPEVMPLLPLSGWLETQQTGKQGLYSSTSDTLRLMLSPAAEKTLHDFPPPAAELPLILLVGPEGGFTADEAAAASLAGFSSLKLGKRILRTETAALAAIAAMQVLWGDY